MDCYFWHIDSLGACTLNPIPITKIKCRSEVCKAARKVSAQIHVSLQPFSQLKKQNLLRQNQIEPLMFMVTNVYPFISSGHTESAQNSSGKSSRCYRKFAFAD